MITSRFVIGANTHGLLQGLDRFFRPACIRQLDGQRVLGFEKIGSDFHRRAVVFDCQVGLSDHTMGIGAAVASVAIGATMIEKHFTLNRADGGVDAAFSIEPDEMRTLVDETKRAWQALGKIIYGPTEKEKKSLVFRRSLYIVQDMKKGDVFTRENLRAIRPGLGLSPKYYEMLLGKRVKTNVKRGTAMSWDISEL